MRISLNDNLLNRCSLASVRAVMAHEMGHYVMNHVYKGLIEMGLVLTVGFAFCAWAFDRIVARRGEAWGVRSIADPAGLPLIVLLYEHVHVRHDAGDEHHHPHRGDRGRRVRPERGAESPMDSRTPL